jgi:DNA polymerase III subunit epsilon
MDFVAIDFETANFRSDSPCQVGIVGVESGQIVLERCWLIRPKNMYFSQQCISIHGILPEHVRDQPEWDVIWSELQPLVAGKPLIAHNASFDLRVLVSTLSLYDLPCPDLDYSCTRLVARRSWPGMGGYGLKVVAESLGFPFRHHDALEDARACARVLLESARQQAAQSLDELEDKLGLVRGRVRYGNCQGPRSLRRSKAKADEIAPSRNVYSRSGFPERAARIRQRRAAVESLAKSCESSRPLQGKSLVLQGSLLGLVREDAVEFLTRLGANVQSHVNMQTDFVVLGHAIDGDESESFDARRAVAEVAERQSEGQPLRQLTQRQLLALVPGGLSMARSLSGDTR